MIAELDNELTLWRQRVGNSDLDYYGRVLPTIDTNGLKSEMLGLVEECRQLRRIARHASALIRRGTGSWNLMADALGEWESSDE